MNIEESLNSIIKNGRTINNVKIEKGKYIKILFDTGDNTKIDIIPKNIEALKNVINKSKTIYLDKVKSSNNKKIMSILSFAFTIVKSILIMSLTIYLILNFGSISIVLPSIVGFAGLSWILMDESTIKIKNIKNKIKNYNELKNKDLEKIYNKVISEISKIKTIEESNSYTESISMENNEKRNSQIKVFQKIKINN